MPLLISLLPLSLSIVLVACFVKLAVRMLPKTTVSWEHSFLFAGLLFGLTLARVLFVPAVPGFVPPLIPIAGGFGLAFIVGIWFFSGRAVSADGTPVGLAGGAKISALSFGLMLLASLPLLAFVRVLAPR